MLTFGDLVTQILIFFVLLFSFSSIDIQKFEQAIASIQGALGILVGGRTVTTPVNVESSTAPPASPLPTDPRDLVQMEAIRAQLAETLAAAGLEAEVLLQSEERGLVVRFADRVLFDLGRADITPAGRAVLEALVPVLRAVPNQIRVEGHTDDWPIRTAQFPSNWELSAARAVNVVRLLVEQHGLDPTRLSAAGYGEYRPVAPNDTAANRQLNRRVDVVILYLSAGRPEPD